MRLLHVLCFFNNKTSTYFEKTKTPGLLDIAAFFRNVPTRFSCLSVVRVQSSGPWKPASCFVSLCFVDDVSLSVFLEFLWDQKKYTCTELEL